MTAPDVPEALPDIAGATVLIVDDVPENLGVLGELLRTQGYRVQLATSGALALRHAAQTPQPDLILLDVMMPGMDGYEVLRRLRADAATRQIPVMILSALDEARDEELGFMVGASDYISKPFQPAVVLARVRVQLEAALLRRWRGHAQDWLLAQADSRTAAALAALAAQAQTWQAQTWQAQTWQSQPLPQTKESPAALAAELVAKWPQPLSPAVAAALERCIDALLMLPPQPPGA